MTIKKFKTNSRIYLGLLLAFLPVVKGFSNNGWVVRQPTVQNKATEKSNSEFYARLPAQFKDDIVQGQKAGPLTEAQQHQAAVWGLTPAEESRYLMLMQNQSGVYYARPRQTSALTPVQILGINARSDSERGHFARLAAEQNAQRTAKELSFATAYQNAYKAMLKPYHLPVVRPFATPVPSADDQP